MNLERNLVTAAILGHAIGDALGVPVEFESRSVLRQDPVLGMRGHGTYDVPAGTWSDDTSLTLALLDSLAQQRAIDPDSIMKNFRRWLDTAAFTPADTVFDVGAATRKAIQRYAAGTAPLACGGRLERDNGNGALMRILPLVLWLYARSAGELAVPEVLAKVHEVASLTHAHPISLVGCGIYSLLAGGLLAGKPVPDAVRDALQDAREFYDARPEFRLALAHYERLWRPNFSALPDTEIRSSGYVVDTLEAAVWCLLTTKGYAACVLRSVNLGEDTDTVAAVAGGLAAIRYGQNDIPEEWLQQLVRREAIEALCQRFIAALAS